MVRIKNFDLASLAEEAGVKPGELRQILALLYTEGPIDNNSFLQKTGLAKSILREIKKEIFFLLEKPSAVTALNSQGKILVKQIVENPDPKEWSKKARLILNKYKGNRPKPKRNLDQFWATQKTIIKRVSLMQEQHDLEERKILFLGDSDLTSIVTACLKNTFLIQVLDFDQEILGFLDLMSKKEKLEIKCLHYDACAPLPTSLINYFDVVFTDPPYTPNGFGLFLSRGLQALKKKNTSRVYFCYGHSRKSNERELKIQQIVVDSGILIDYKISAFNEYLEARSIGNRSSIYIGEITPLSRPLITGKFAGKIYSGQIKAFR